MQHTVLRANEDTVAAEMFESAHPLQSAGLTFFKSLEVQTVRVYADKRSRKYLLVVIEVEMLSAGGRLSLIL